MALGSESQSTRTPLETLILQRCTAPSSRLDQFQAILSRPRALRSLIVLLDVDFRQFGMQLDTQRVHALDFVGAIQQQSDSLEYLRYMHRPVKRPGRGSPEHLNPSLFSTLATLRESSPGLSTFHRLHTFHVDHRSNLAEFLLYNPLAPPNLRTLGLTGIGYDYDISWCHLPAFVSAIASTTPFSHLRLHTLPNGYDIADVSKMFSRPAPTSGYNSTPQLRDVFLSLVKTLDKKRTLKLVCSRFARQLAGFHPPFLYGEHMPDEAVIFDSEKLWSGDGDVDERFTIERYISEEEEVSGWSGPFSALGNSFWRE
jgi:hypothetical protein